MTVRFTGPVLNKEYNPNGGSARAAFSNLPIGIQVESSYAVVSDHFNSVFDATATVNVPWLIVKDSGATTALGDAAGGVFNLSGQQSTNTSGVTIYSPAEVVKLASGKEVWFQALFAMNDATSASFFTGYCTRPGTFDDPEDVISEADLIGFIKAKATTAVKAISVLGGATTSTAVSTLTTANTLYQLYWDGKNKVDFFIDNTYVTSMTSVPNTTELMIVPAHVLSGSTAGTKTLALDAVVSVQKV